MLCTHLRVFANLCMNLLDRRAYLFKRSEIICRQRIHVRHERVHLFISGKFKRFFLGFEGPSLSPQREFLTWGIRWWGQISFIPSRLGVLSVESLRLWRRINWTFEPTFALIFCAFVCVFSWGAGNLLSFVLRICRIKNIRMSHQFRILPIIQQKNNIRFPSVPSRLPALYARTCDLLVAHACGQRWQAGCEAFVPDNVTSCWIGCWLIG